MLFYKQLGETVVRKFYMFNAEREILIKNRLFLLSVSQNCISNVFCGVKSYLKFLLIHFSLNIFDEFINFRLNLSAFEQYFHALK